MKLGLIIPCSLFAAERAANFTPINQNTSKSYYGWVVAAFSIGQFISAPLFGFWSQFRPAREPIAFALLLSSLSNILYAYCNIFPSSLAIYIVLVSRFFIGFSFGMTSVMRAFISTATTEKERTSSLANLSVARSLGFILGPVVGFIFQPIGYPGLTIPHLRLMFNLYTGPAYLCTVLGVCNLIFFIWFKDNSKKKSQRNSPTLNGEETPLINDRKAPSHPFDRLAAAICIFECGLFTMVWTSFETLITPYSMDEFAWSNQEAIFYNNIIFAINGVLSLIVLTVAKVLVKRIQERTLLIGALLVLATGVYIFIPWPGEYPYLKPSLINASSTLGNSSHELVGCDFLAQPWCSSVPKLRDFQYWLGPIIFSLSFPMVGILLITIFSKVLGPHPPGVMMGVFTSGGALARVVGPVGLAHLYVYTGPQVTFSVIVGVIFIAILLLLICFPRLVPFKSFPSQTE